MIMFVFFIVFNVELVIWVFLCFSEFIVGIDKLNMVILCLFCIKFMVIGLFILFKLINVMCVIFFFLSELVDVCFLFKEN